MDVDSGHPMTDDERMDFEEHQESQAQSDSIKPDGEMEEDQDQAPEHDDDIPMDATADDGMAVEGLEEDEEEYMEAEPIEPIPLATPQPPLISPHPPLFPQFTPTPTPPVQPNHSPGKVAGGNPFSSSFAAVPPAPAEVEDVEIDDPVEAEEGAEYEQPEGEYAEGAGWEGDEGEGEGEQYEEGNEGVETARDKVDPAGPLSTSNAVRDGEASVENATEAMATASSPSSTSEPIPSLPQEGPSSQMTSTAKANGGPVEPPREAAVNTVDSMLQQQQGESSAMGAMGKVNGEQTADHNEEEEVEEEYYDEEVDIDIEDTYPHDIHCLPPIVLNIDELGARSLFQPLEEVDKEEKEETPVWLKDREEELGEASLVEVWGAIRAEIPKKHVPEGAVLIITEKVMGLTMREDDPSVEAVSFLELVQVLYGCGLDPPLEFYLSFEHRFSIRFPAIQKAVMVQDGQGESGDVPDVEDMDAEDEPEEAESRSKAIVEEGVTAKQPVLDKAVVAEHAKDDQEVEEVEEYEYEETEEEAEEPEESKPDEEEARRNREELVRKRRDRVGGDARAEYGGYKKVIAPESEHPNADWAHGRPIAPVHVHGTRIIVAPTVASTEDDEFDIATLPPPPTTKDLVEAEEERGIEHVDDANDVDDADEGRDEGKSVEGAASGEKKRADPDKDTASSGATTEYQNDQTRDKTDMSYFDRGDQLVNRRKDEIALLKDRQAQSRSDFDEAVVLDDDDVSSVKPLSETELLANKILHGEAEVVPTIETPGLSTALDITAFTLPTPGEKYDEEEEDEGYGDPETTAQEDLADAQDLLANAAAEQSRTGDLLEEAGDLAALQNDPQMETAILDARARGLDSAEAIVDAREAVLDAQIERSVYDDETDVDRLANRLVEESADPLSGTPTTVDDEDDTTIPNSTILDSAPITPAITSNGYTFDSIPEVTEVTDATTYTSVDGVLVPTSTTTETSRKRSLVDDDSDSSKRHRPEGSDDYILGAER